jgi:hypothetical protein
MLARAHRTLWNVVTTSPDVVGWTASRLCRRAFHRPDGAVDLLSSDELLRRWGRSTAALRHAGLSPAARLDLALGRHDLGLVGLSISGGQE